MADQDVLEIEVEDVGDTSWVGRVATTLASQPAGQGEHWWSAVYTRPVG